MRKLTILFLECSFVTYSPKCSRVCSSLPWCILPLCAAMCMHTVTTVTSIVHTIEVLSANLAHAPKSQIGKNG